MGPVGISWDTKDKKSMEWDPRLGDENESKKEKKGKGNAQSKRSKNWREELVGSNMLPDVGWMTFKLDVHLEDCKDAGPTPQAIREAAKKISPYMPEQFNKAASWPVNITKVAMTTTGKDGSLSQKKAFTTVEKDEYVVSWICNSFFKHNAGDYSLYKNDFFVSATNLRSVYGGRGVDNGEITWDVIDSIFDTPGMYHKLDGFPLTVEEFTLAESNECVKLCSIGGSDAQKKKTLAAFDWLNGSKEEVRANGLKQFEGLLNDVGDECLLSGMNLAYAGIRIAEDSCLMDGHYDILRRGRAGQKIGGRHGYSRSVDVALLCEKFMDFLFLCWECRGISENQMDHILTSEGTPGSTFFKYSMRGVEKDEAYALERMNLVKTWLLSSNSERMHRAEKVMYFPCFFLLFSYLHGNTCTIYTVVFME